MSRGVLVLLLYLAGSLFFVAGSVLALLEQLRK